MTDDRGTSGDFQAFSATCAGQCLAAAEEALVRRALAVWPEQGPTLLEINCGAGLLQRPLRAMGFDVTGCEGSPALREAFARSLGIRHVADPAVCDLLPYGDGSFDWALLHLERGASSEQVEKALAEAGRTALRGLAVLFWNRLSLAGLTSGSLPLLPLSSWSLQRRLASLAVGRMRSSSALALPVRFWSAAAGSEPEGRAFCLRQLARCLRRSLNAPLPRCFGSVCLLTLEFPPSAPMTATPLRVRRVVFDSKLACTERAFEGSSLHSGEVRRDDRL